MLVLIGIGSCTLESVEIVNLVAIAAPVLEITGLNLPIRLQWISHDSCLPHARLHVLENLLGKAGWSPAVMADGR